MGQQKFVTGKLLDISDGFSNILKIHVRHIEDGILQLAVDRNHQLGIFVQAAVTLLFRKSFQLVAG